MRTSIVLLVLSAVVAGQGFGELAKATSSLRLALERGQGKQAVDALRAIPGQYPFADEKAQRQAVAAVGKAVRSSDQSVRRAALAALSVLHARGSSKYLAPWLDPPSRFKGPVPPEYIEAILAAGAIADNATLDRLRKLSRHADLTIAMTAMIALGGYHRLPVARRKELAFELVDRLTRLDATVVSNKKKNRKARERNVGLAAAAVKALRQLTGQNLKTAVGWRNWKGLATTLRDPF